MFKPQANKINYLGSAVFVLLVYLLLSALAENPGNFKDARKDYKNSTELYISLAAITEFQQNGFLNYLLPSEKNFRLKQDNTEPALISFNKTILQKITFLEKNSLLIKPDLHPRFYNQYYTSETGDPPHLS